MNIIAIYEAFYAAILNIKQKFPCLLVLKNVPPASINREEIHDSQRNLLNLSLMNEVQASCGYLSFLFGRFVMQDRTS